MNLYVDRKNVYFCKSRKRVLLLGFQCCYSRRCRYLLNRDPILLMRVSSQCQGRLINQWISPLSFEWTVVLNTFNYSPSYTFFLNINIHVSTCEWICYLSFIYVISNEDIDQGSIIKYWKKKVMVREQRKQESALKWSSFNRNDNKNWTTTNYRVWE